MQSETIKRNLQLARAIQKALDEDKLILGYQPVMDLNNPDKPIFMLTCRMQTNRGQLIAYQSLRQLSSMAKLDLKLDRWLVLKGIKSIKKLRKSDPGARIFIPLSAVSVTTDGFPEWLSRQQDLHDFPGNGMILKFRLSELSQDIAAAQQCIARLHKLNIRISLQNFSDNPIALKVLKMLDAEYIEIPPRLLRTESRTIGNILQVCRKLGVTVVLCGISATDDINLDWSDGTNMLMGDYIHPLMDDMEFRFPATLC